MFTNLALGLACLCAVLIGLILVVRIFRNCPGYRRKTGAGEYDGEERRSPR